MGEALQDRIQRFRRRTRCGYYKQKAMRSIRIDLENMPEKSQDQLVFASSESFDDATFKEPTATRPEQYMCKRKRGDNGPRKAANFR